MPAHGTSTAARGLEQWVSDMEEVHEWSDFDELESRTGRVLGIGRSTSRTRQRRDVDEPSPGVRPRDGVLTR